MILRDELSAYVATLLDLSIDDFCPNGLQVSGREEVRKMVTGVTASKALIEAAIDARADALIVHHGYFWKGEAAPIVGVKHGRIKALINADLNLFAYHLPLDIHPEFGNNVQLAKRVGWTPERSVAAGGIEDVLWVGKTSVPMSADDFSKVLTKTLKREALHIAGHDKPISRVAWCTGAAQNFITEAAQLGADAYVTGEVSERSYHDAQELGVHFFAAGHHATERYGIQALGTHLAAHFDLEHEFIDIDNPI